MAKKWVLAKQGNVAKGDWNWCIREGDGVRASINHLNPFNGYMEAEEAASLMQRAPAMQEALFGLILLLEQSSMEVPTYVYEALGKRMKSYRGSSCHDVGYRLEVDAPDNVEPSALNDLISTLIDYTDEPSTQAYLEMLSDDDYMEDFYSKWEYDITDLKAITVYADPVNRECFLNDRFEEVK